MGWIIGLIFSTIFTLLFLAVSGDPAAGDVRGILISFVVLDAMFLYFYIRSRKKKKIKKEETIKLQDKLRCLGASSSIQAKHVAGLPLGQGAECAIYLCDDKVVFEKDANTFNLPFSKVSDITVKTDTEIQKQYVSSIGGAVGGAVLFGPLGAIVGGRTKEKTSKKENKYLIYTYQKDKSVDYISFDVTDIYQHQLKPFVEYYNSLQKEQMVVNL